MVRESELTKEFYKTGEAAKYLEVSPKTLYVWTRNGKVGYQMSSTGRVQIPRQELVNILKERNLLVESLPRRDAVYARVSSHGQKSVGDLDRQALEIIESSSPYKIYDPLIIKDVGSGLNTERKGLIKLMDEAEKLQIGRIFITHPESYLRSEFELTETEVLQIKSQHDARQAADNDINYSPQENNQLLHAITVEHLRYPHIRNERFDYDEVVELLDKLSAIFNVGEDRNKSLDSSDFRRFLAGFIIKWMSGYTLKQLVTDNINYRRDNPDKFWYNHKKEYYLDIPEHKNAVIEDTLSTLQNTVLFTLSNWFHKMSAEIKKQCNLTNLSNDWYEFLEFGSIDPIIINLQKYGYSREVAKLVKETNLYLEDDFLENDELTYHFYLSRLLLSSHDESIRRESLEVSYNFPELFQDFNKLYLG